MKHALIIISTLLLSLTCNHALAQSDDLVNVCALGIGNATYLKDFKVKLPANTTTPQKLSVILTKGMIYKFVVCNAEGYEGKAVIHESVRGSDLFILSDVGNHDMEYMYYGVQNRKSYNDHFVETLNMIDACANTPSRIWLVTPLLYASRQHKREGRESLNCAQSLRIFQYIGVNGIITFDAHDPAVRSALNTTSFDTIYITNTMVEHFLKTENIDFNKI